MRTKALDFYSPHDPQPHYSASLCHSHHRNCRRKPFLSPLVTWGGVRPPQPPMGSPASHPKIVRWLLGHRVATSHPRFGSPATYRVASGPLLGLGVASEPNLGWLVATLRPRGLSLSLFMALPLPYPQKINPTSSTTKDQWCLLRICDAPPDGEYQLTSN
jgi:hypothetical protein